MLALNIDIIHIQFVDFKLFFSINFVMNFQMPIYNSRSRLEIFIKPYFDKRRHFEAKVYEKLPKFIWKGTKWSLKKLFFLVLVNINRFSEKSLWIENTKNRYLVVLNKLPIIETRSKVSPYVPSKALKAWSHDLISSF